jgi:hypothetical protein
MKNNLVNEDIKRMRMIMGYNRSKTLNENFEIISEITGVGATPPDGTSLGTTGSGTAGAVKTYTVPSELKNVTDFQNWAVKNGFGSELGPRGVDGKYGRYTAAAFAKHKDVYLKNPLPDDEYTVAVDAEDASDVQKNTTDNTTQTTGATPSAEVDANDVLKGGA